MKGDFTIMQRDLYYYIFENNPEWLNAVVDSDSDFLGERWQQIFLKEATKILERRKNDLSFQ